MGVHKVKTCQFCQKKMRSDNINNHQSRCRKSESFINSINALLFKECSVCHVWFSKSNISRHMKKHGQIKQSEKGDWIEQKKQEDKDINEVLKDNFLVVKNTEEKHSNELESNKEIEKRIVQNIEEVEEERQIQKKIDENVCRKFQQLLKQLIITICLGEQRMQIVHQLLEVDYKQISGKQIIGYGLLAKIIFVCQKYVLVQVIKEQFTNVISRHMREFESLICIYQ